MKTGDTDEIIRYIMEEKLRNPDVVWDVKEHKEHKSRSLDSNSFFWLLVNKIAIKQRISDTEVHDKFLSENVAYFKNDDGGIDWKVAPTEPNAFGLIKEQVNGNYEYYKDSGMVVTLQKEQGDTVKYHDGHEVQGRVYWHIKGTRQMDSKEMSRIISSVVFEAEALGINTLTPAEQAHMIALWGETHDAPKNERGEK